MPIKSSTKTSRQTTARKGASSRSNSRAKIQKTSRSISARKGR